MSLFLTSLNSGSNGNCYYVGTHTEAVLIDAGISCRETEKRMARLGLSMSKVKAIFVSHEHTDHICGIPVLSKKYRLPVYITAGTFKNSGLAIEEGLVSSFNAGEPITIGGLCITAFPKFHDASDPHSFVVNSNQVKVGIFTDIGIACEQVKYHFKQCNAAILEANYDEDMLANGSYPYFLKRRISGGNGHLSNKGALELLMSHRPPCLSHLLLGHLSKNNNCPVLVQQIFSNCAGDTKIVVASRNEETPLYEITHFEPPISPIVKVITRQKHRQLSMF